MTEHRTSALMSPEWQKPHSGDRRDADPGLVLLHEPCTIGTIRGRVMVPAAVLVVLLFMSVPARAQAPYTTAAVGVDVARFDRVEAAGVSDVEAGGEAIAFALRLGTAIGNQWGVELALTRPSEVTHESRQGYPIPLTISVGARQTAPIDATGLVIPVVESRIRMQRRNTTLDAMAWVAQRAGARADLVYLAGIAFSRITEDVDFAFTGRPVALILPTSTRTTMYAVGPVVGAEGRIRLTDHVILVPGIRLQALGGNGRHGWLLRAAAGLGWRF